MIGAEAVVSHVDVATVDINSGVVENGLRQPFDKSGCDILHPDIASSGSIRIQVVRAGMKEGQVLKSKAGDRRVGRTLKEEDPLVASEGATSTYLGYVRRRVV